MTSKQIEEKVVASLRRLGCNVDEILPVHALQYDLGIDSTEMVELTALIRNEFGMQAQHIDLHGVETVGDMATKLEQLLGQQGARPAEDAARPH